MKNQLIFLALLSSACAPSSVALLLGSPCESTQQFSFGDFDADGKQDIVSRAGERVCLSLQQGTLGATIDTPFGELPPFVTDADNDGDEDLITTIAGETHILKNQGDATFADELFPNPLAPEAIQVKSFADLDGDGDIDAVARSENRLSFVVLLNQGDSTFAPQQSVLIGVPINDLMTADISNDGSVDILTTNSGEQLRAFLNQGDARFSAPTVSRVDLTGFEATKPPILFDLDNDGNLDIAGASGFSEVSIARNDGRGSFTTTLQSAPFEDFSLHNIAAGDLNGDGLLDLVLSFATVVETGGAFFGSEDPEASVQILLNKGNMQFKATRAGFPIVTGGLDFEMTSFLQNMDEDPELELITAGDDSNALFFDDLAL